MSGYLNTLHTRSDAHKKRFAFVVSLGSTLMIFSIWSFVHFATPGGSAGTTPVQNAAVLLAVENGDGSTAPVSDQYENTALSPTPFDNFKTGIEASWDALKEGFSQAKESTVTLQNSLQNEYSDVRATAIDGSADTTHTNGQ